MKNKSYSAASKTVLKINKGGFVFTVLYRENDTVNPYRIYNQYYEHGTLHKKQIAKYGDFTSCMYYLYQFWYKVEH